jgi:RHS repeat-associated protein
VQNGFDYLGSVVYKRESNIVTGIESTSFGGGRINATTNTYDINYFITDHLGSTRVIVGENGNIKEQNDYYPFGLRHENASLISAGGRWGYNGKEKQIVGAINYLDFANRMYDDFLGRWFVQDLLQEKGYSISSYAFSFNNPLVYVDPDGRWGRKIHNQILRTAFANELASGEISKAQFKAILKADKKMDRRENQKPKMSYLHSMRDGTTDQSVEEAKADRDRFVSTEIDNFADATDDDTAFEHLGSALHPISDEDAPSHNWEPWSGSGFLWIKGIKHASREVSSNKKEIAASVEKVKKTYKEAKQKREQKQQEKREQEKRKEEEEENNKNARPWE